MENNFNWAAFSSLGDPDLAGTIIRIRNNDPEVKRLTLGLTHEFLSQRSWRRLGRVVGQNTRLEELYILHCDLDAAIFFAGLRNNRSIQKLEIVGMRLHNPEQRRSVSQFFGLNPSLAEITLKSCNIQPIDSIDIVVSNYISNHPENALEKLDLSDNKLGEIDLEYLVAALGKAGRLRRLCLADNRIGKKGCASLAKLLENKESNVEELNLFHNSIRDNSAIILANSLVKNTKLQRLILGDNKIATSAGWSAMLKLVCNYSSIAGVVKSNHSLSSAGMGWPGNRGEIERALGVDDANLFHASLHMNRSSNKMSVARHKILWSHARGYLNIGQSSIAIGAMPRILSWIGDNSNETNAYAIQYHRPPLPKGRVDTIRLDSVYRVVRSVPSLCIINETDQVPKAKPS